METETIFRRLKQLDVSVRADRGEIVLNPGDRVPVGLREEIRLRKADLLDQLTDDSEVVEIVRQVREQGYVLLWSNTLQDLVAFTQTDADRDNVPPGFTTYNHRTHGSIRRRDTLSRLPQTYPRGQEARWKDHR